MDRDIHTATRGVKGCIVAVWGMIELWRLLLSEMAYKLRESRDLELGARRQKLWRWVLVERRSRSQIPNHTKWAGISSHPSPDQTWWHIMYSLQFASARQPISNIFTRGECLCACLMMYYAKVSRPPPQLVALSLKWTRITSGHNNIRVLL